MISDCLRATLAGRMTQSLDQQALHGHHLPRRLQQALEQGRLERSQMDTTTLLTPLRTIKIEYHGAPRKHATASLIRAGVAQTGLQPQEKLRHFERRKHDIRRTLGQPRRTISRNGHRRKEDDRSTSERATFLQAPMREGRAWPQGKVQDDAPVGTMWQNAFELPARTNGTQRHARIRPHRQQKPFEPTVAKGQQNLLA